MTIMYKLTQTIPLAFGKPVPCQSSNRSTYPVLPKELHLTLICSKKYG